jgi:hypothetical protein
MEKERLLGRARRVRSSRGPRGMAGPESSGARRHGAPVGWACLSLMSEVSTLTFVRINGLTHVITALTFS